MKLGRTVEQSLAVENSVTLTKGFGCRPSPGRCRRRLRWRFWPRGSGRRCRAGSESITSIVASLLFFLHFTRFEGFNGDLFGREVPVVAFRRRELGREDGHVVVADPRRFRRHLHHLQVQRRRAHCIDASRTKNKTKHGQTVLLTSTA